MCDNVHIDPATGKHFILGIFSNVRAREFPTKHPRMIWFLTLTDVPVGQHTLGISFGLPMGEMKQLISRDFESKSPLHRLNLINDIQNLAFEEPGSYSIVIEVDNEIVLATSLGVSN